MPNVGPLELAIVLIIALVIFGPKRLPELGKSLGRSINEFKRASNELKNTLEDEIRVEEQRTTAPPKPAPPAADTSVPREADSGA
jgi:sec-independent protein translocase protein TatA